MSDDGDQWTLLVPVKRLAIAKTRLELPVAARAELALAMACDTVGAALAAAAVTEVVVITDDERAADALAGIGARVIGDGPNAGLNPALVHGAAAAGTTRVAALSSDLPALRSADLEAWLARAGGHRRAIVADASGSGTTVLSAIEAGELSPAFGVGSRAIHVSSGAVDLSTPAGASLRHDVDTVAALHAAVEIGLGRHTAAAIGRLEIRL